MQKLVIACLFAFACETYHAGQLYGEGTRALDRGATAVAIEALEQAGELAPHASEIQNHLGLAYAAAGRDFEARAAFERAVALDCDNSAAVHNLARAQAKAVIEVTEVGGNDRLVEDRRP